MQGHNSRALYCQKVHRAVRESGCIDPQLELDGNETPHQYHCQGSGPENLA